MDEKVKTHFSTVSIDLGEGRFLQIQQVKSQSLNQVVSHLLEEDGGLEEAQLNDDKKWSQKGKLPYWSAIWDVSIGLAQALSKMNLEGLQIIEIGAGTAIAGIAAALKGGSVIVSDYEPQATKLAEENGALNGAHFTTKVLDWSKYEQWPKDQFDVVIGADILYKASAAKHLAGLIPLILKDGGIAIIADAGRSYLNLFKKKATKAGMRVHRYPPCFFVHQDETREVIFLELSKGGGDEGGGDGDSLSNSRTKEIQATLNSCCQRWKWGGQERGENTTTLTEDTQGPPVPPPIPPPMVVLP